MYFSKILAHEHGDRLRMELDGVGRTLTLLNLITKKGARIENIPQTHGVFFISGWQLIATMKDFQDPRAYSYDERRMHNS